AIQRMAELREVLQELEAARGRQLDPPWTRFAQVAEECGRLADEVAGATGRDREELLEHVRAQERYAEQAYEERNQQLYRECLATLPRSAGSLTDLLRDALPQALPARRLSPEEAAREAVDGFRGYLGQVWKKVRAAGRDDLEARLSRLAEQAQGLSGRAK